jgi:hypothetical protein
MMKWENGSIICDHPRAPWRLPQDGQALVHCKLERLKGTDPSYGNQKATYRLAYAKAKTTFDVEVALDIVERCIQENVIDALADVIFYTRKAPILVFPHLPFDDEDEVVGKLPLTETATNAVPFAYARFLAETLGGTISSDIIQVARVGRTRLPRWMKFICQPSFEGPVVTDRPYLILDDVMATGGTLAALRSYLIRQGGTVAGITTLANKSGLHQKFAIADQTLNVLKSTYGSGLERYWKETFGHDLHALTEDEAQFLAVFPAELGGRRGDELLFDLRERINQAAAKGG